MSIGQKILLGCLSLTLLTGLLGAFDSASEQDLGLLATRIYDRTFMAMSYLRSAQIAFTVAAGHGNLESVKDRVIEDLEVAEQRAMSPQGAAAAAALRTRVKDYGESADAEAEALAIGDAFDTAVEIYAGDGHKYRRTVGVLVERTVRGTWIAITASVLIALIITTLLRRSIVPALRAAVGVAEKIARGHLDNRIDTGQAVAGGRSETGHLLLALDVMQSSIADNIACINRLMAEQASSHAGELAVRSARFAAALNNMSQGLCLFDAELRLIVANERFAGMFGTPVMGAEAEAVLRAAGLDCPIPHPSVTSTQSLVLELEDGRSIAVSQQSIPQGGFAATYEDVTERRRSESRLAHMARHDSLTGLPNRVLFREHMETVLARVRRGEGVGILCLDLDRFKVVNDTLGHPVGDELLQAVAKRLLDCTRETDMVVRLGGDEFAIVQSEATQPTDATALARRLLETLCEPFDLGGHRVVIGTSIGIALAADGPADANGLLKNADIALYRAKADGRGTYHFFDPKMDAQIQARRLLELDLRAAVDNGEMELFYQPLVGTSGHAIQGLEALVRWRHPKRGMVSPGEFIPLAEEIGLIGRIGEWVLRRACQDAAGLPDDVTVAVNLSPLQFRNPALAATVKDALAASRLPAGRLELEITESVLLQESDAVIGILHEIRALGVRISMDDFGTGYSSLSYLRRFPFDKIKIDQSFVRNLVDRHDCLAIVRAVINLGRALGMSVVAEGVETPEQLEMLRAEGCRQVQGYLFSPPRPLKDLANLPRIPAQHRTPELAAAVP